MSVFDPRSQIRTDLGLLQKATDSPLPGASCVETVGIRPVNLQTEGRSPFPDVSSDRHTS